MAAFASWDEAVSLNSAKLLTKLVADCEICFKARQVEASAGSGEYSGGDTNWFPVDATPRCLLEQLVQAIFRSHAGDGGGFDPSNAGAEWWTLSIDPEDDIGLHFDKDYGTEADTGENATPSVATVTYLSDEGAPTIVLDQPCPARVGDPLDDGTAPIRAGWLSFPKPGKHVRFDGRLLHGAPALGTSGVPCGGRGRRRRRRVSLLVNCWIDRRPRLASPLPEDLARRLSPRLTRVPFALATPSEIVRLSSTPGGGGGGSCDDFHWSVAQEGEGESTLFVRLPIDRIAEVAQEVPGASIELQFHFGGAVCFEN